MRPTVAVIGSGVTGLTAAHRLQRLAEDVELDDETGAPRRLSELCRAVRWTQAAGGQTEVGRPSPGRSSRLVALRSAW